MATATLTSISGETFDASSMFTCLSCSIAFASAEDQRAHYRSDHHRYNMKRRVASLPPVSAAIFNQKVLERRQETSVQSSLKGAECRICDKTYTTENAYRSHIQSKKHRELEAKYNAKLQAQSQDTPSSEPTLSIQAEAPVPAPAVQSKPSASARDDNDEDIVSSIEARLARARLNLSPSDCLFCQHSSTSLEDNLTHMGVSHGFFIPDSEYLTDLEGLLTYLGEKISIGNVCIYCYSKKRRYANNKAWKKVDNKEDGEEDKDVGREFRSLEAVRRHMTDKGHCKISYDTEEERLEISDYYDFSSSYPSGRKKAKKAKENEDWEEMEGSGEEVDEVVDEATSDEDDSEELENGIRFGDTPFELVLPSGARIGHRSLARYYKQNPRPSIPPKSEQDEDPNSGRALARRLVADNKKLLSDKNSALVPRKGGFGAHGEGMELVKARNAGEAREAGRHVKEFRDVKRREDFKTKIGFVGNNQKHFRDPLLQ